MSKIPVLIVDDHTIVREGIRLILALYDDIDVVGEAADGREAIDKVGAMPVAPLVVLMDIVMPGLGGLEAMQEVLKINPQCRVVVLTQYDDAEYIHRFLKFGAAGYVLKKAVGTDLVSAIRAVYQGKAFLDPLIADKVIKSYVSQPGVDHEETSYSRLSDREKQVLKLIAEGYTNQRIADELCLSIKTVMAHRTNLMEKLSIHNRTDLVKFAIRRGVVRADPGNA